MDGFSPCQQQQQPQSYFHSVIPLSNAFADESMMFMDNELLICLQQNVDTKLIAVRDVLLSRAPLEKCVVCGL